MTVLDEAGQARWLLEQLGEAIARLASPPEQQLAYLRRLDAGESADELALEFDDVAGAALSRPRLLTDEQRDAVRHLDRQLEAMSGTDKARLWATAAIGSAEEWTEVRRRAKRALSVLHSTWQA